MSPDGQLRPVCFMITPFSRKKVGNSAKEGSPHEIDFDALWDKAFRPAIEEAGYTPIRADFDTGSVIVKDMLERLAFADLVVADVSLPNGNVYYEVGLRHVAKQSGCIMFAADWSRQLFDIDQFTTVRYALTDGDVKDVEAASIRETVRQSISCLKNSKTPWHEFISSSADVNTHRGVFREFAEQLSVFQAEIRATRLTDDKQTRKKKVENLLDTLPISALEIADIAIEMCLLVRDQLGWQKNLDFVNTLPDSVANIPIIQEQRLLALANVGQPEDAIANLEQLMVAFGETPERLGLIGGRYKRMFRAARGLRIDAEEERLSRKERRYLNQAIIYYTRGMQLDYNQFYCSSNIAQLLLARGQVGDAEQAVIVDHFVVAACERAISRNEDDEWTRPTLLGAAFRARDINKAMEFASRIDEEGIDAWKLESTIADVADAVRLATDTPEVQSLRDIYQDLDALLSEEFE